MKIKASGVAFTPCVLRSWSERLEESLITLMEMGVLIHRCQIGNKQCIIDVNTGVLTVQVQLANYLATMEVNPGGWCWAN